jgi:CRP-like cAMP-binding protein
MNTLQEFILGFIAANDKKLIDHISPLITKRAIRKNDFLLHEGIVCRKLSFITKGVCYKYIMREKGECVIQFYDEGGIAGDYCSFINQEPGKYCIKTLEDLEVQELKYSDINLLCNTSPVFERVYRKIAEHYLGHMADRLFSFQHEGPVKRYLNLLRERPVLIQRVPLYLIASYLGITPVGLSKIRSRISNKGKLSVVLNRA